MAEYVETVCKSLINRVKGMPFRWSANPYRGCAHDCQYCFARTTHEFLNLTGRDFARVIQVKMNAAEALRTDLRRPGWKRERVALGTATDPYQPIEGRYRITQACLEAFAEARTPVTIVTKGTLIVGDIDLLRRIPDITVCISLPTVDRDLWHRLEPGTPPPDSRLRAVRRLVDAGIEAGVFAAPLVPGLTTRSSHLTRLVEESRAAGARFVVGSVLHLKVGVRDHFFQFLAREYPALLAGYRRLYPGKYADDAYRDTLKARFLAITEAAGIAPDPFEAVVRDRERQLPLWNLAESRMSAAG